MTNKFDIYVCRFRSRVFKRQPILFIYFFFFLGEATGQWPPRLWANGQFLILSGLSERGDPSHSFIFHSSCAMARIQRPLPQSQSQSQIACCGCVRVSGPLPWEKPVK